MGYLDRSRLLSSEQVQVLSNCVISVHGEPISVFGKVGVPWVIVPCGQSWMNVAFDLAKRIRLHDMEHTFHELKARIEADRVVHNKLLVMPYVDEDLLKRDKQFETRSREFLEKHNADTAEQISKSQVEQVIKLETRALERQHRNTTISALLKRSMALFGVPKGFQSLQTVPPERTYNELEIEAEFENLRFLVGDDLPDEILKEIAASSAVRPNNKHAEKARLKSHAREWFGAQVDAGTTWQNKSEAIEDLRTNFPALSKRQAQSIWTEVAPPEFTKAGRKRKKLDR